MRAIVELLVLQVLNSARREFRRERIERERERAVGDHETHNDARGVATRCLDLIEWRCCVVLCCSRQAGWRDELGLVGASKFGASRRIRRWMRYAAASGNLNRCDDWTALELTRRKRTEEDGDEESGTGNTRTRCGRGDVIPARIPG